MSCFSYAHDKRLQSLTPKALSTANSNCPRLHATASSSWIARNHITLSQAAATKVPGDLEVEVNCGRSPGPTRPGLSRTVAQLLAFHTRHALDETRHHSVIYTPQAFEDHGQGRADAHPRFSRSAEWRLQCQYTADQAASACRQTASVPSPAAGGMCRLLLPALQAH